MQNRSWFERNHMQLLNVIRLQNINHSCQKNRLYKADTKQSERRIYKQG